MAGEVIYGNGTTTASSGANTVVHFYDRAGIKAANAVNIYSQFCDRKSMPQNMGKTYKISKWQHIYDLAQDDADFSAKGYLGKRTLDSVSTNLANSGGAGTIAEGAGAVNKVTPKKVTVEASLARYGFMIEYTDEVVMFSEDMVQTKYREELGYLINQAAEDLIQKDMLNSAGIVVNGGGDITMAQMGDTVTLDDTNADLYKVSFDLIRKGVKALVRNRAVRNTEIVTGSNKIGTKPINKAFYAIIGPEVKYDLETLTRGSTYEKEYVYVPAYQYASQSNLAEGEIGSMHDVRFIESEGALIEGGLGAPLPEAYAGTLSYSPNSETGIKVALNTSGASITLSVSATKDIVIPDGDSALITDAEDTYAAANDAVDYGNLTISATGDRFDVFPILFPTKGAFATLGLKGQGRMQFFSKAPNDVNLTNPHGTKGFFSANMWYAGLALQPEKLARINVLATA